MKVECTMCGEDCSHAYATWRGDPYHFGCLPLPRCKKLKDRVEKFDSKGDVSEVSLGQFERAREI